MPPHYTWSQIPIGGGGYIRYVAVNPVNPGIVYAACDVAGVFKSTDGGNSWTAKVEGFDRQEDFGVGSIAIHPRNPDIVYIVTGGRDGGSVWRSDNAGDNWILMHRGLRVDSGGGLPVGQRPSRYILAIDHQVPEILYVATSNEGVCRSNDGGRTFIPAGLEGKYLSGVFMDPLNSSILYAAGFSHEDQPGGVFKTTDGGVSWKTVQEGLDVRAIAIDPSDPETVYAACYWDGVYKSTDGGLTWDESNGSGHTRIPARTVEKWYLKVRDTSPPRDCIFSSIVIDPEMPQTVYVSSRGGSEGNLGIWRSDDGGASWIAAPASNDNVHNEGWWAGELGYAMSGVVHLAIDPINTDRLYLGDFFSVFRSDNRSEDWIPCFRGIENVYLQHIYFNPENPDNIYFGLNDQTLHISHDHGRTLQIASNLRKIRDGRINVGNTMCIDPSTDPTTIYLGTLQWVSHMFGGGIYKSTDNGLNWEAVNKGLPVDRIFYTGAASRATEYSPHRDAEAWVLPDQQRGRVLGGKQWGYSGSCQYLHTSA